MIPEKINVTATMSVITAGPQRILSIAGVKDVTCFVKAEQKLIGLPCLAGEKGDDGRSGTITVGTVTTLPSGSDATVENVGTNTDAVFDFGIPRGESGSGGASMWGEITGTLSDQTDLQTALNAKANTADLGDLATQDTVDYQTEVTNKPTLGALAGMDSIDYTGNYLTNKPTLGTMSAVNDAPSDGNEYVRKNGSWSVASGGTPAWGDITGTLSNQTDLQTALDTKADVTDITLNVFSESVSYNYGQLVIYQSLLYRFVDNHTAGPWDSSDVSRITVSDLLNLKADVQSPALTGTPTAPTPTAGDSSTKIATTAFVQGELDGHILYYTAQTVSAATSAQIMRIPASGTDSAITTDTVVLDINFADPGNITSAVSWESFAGYITFTGTCTAATTANVVLGTKGN